MFSLKRGDKLDLNNKKFDNIDVIVCIGTEHSNEIGVSITDKKSNKVVAKHLIDKSFLEQ